MAIPVYLVRARPARRDPRAVVVSSLNVFLLSSSQFKASFWFAPQMHAGGTDTITKVSFHDLRKLHALLAGSTGSALSLVWAARRQSD